MSFSRKKKQKRAVVKFYLSKKLILIETHRLYCTIFEKTHSWGKMCGLPTIDLLIYTQLSSCKVFFLPTLVAK